MFFITKSIIKIVIKFQTKFLTLHNSISSKILVVIIYYQIILSKKLKRRSLNKNTKLYFIFFYGQKEHLFK